MKTLEEYLQEGILRKNTPDTQRAEALQQEAKRKYASLQTNINALSVTDENANDYIEYCYNIILFLIRAHMYQQGYSAAGKGAHEAEVCFAKTLGIQETDIETLNQLRYFRNGILYYGKHFDAEYAQIIIEFTKKLYKHLQETLQ